MVIRLLSVVFGVCALNAAQLDAAPIVFNTSDSRFDPGVNNQGWWSTSFANVAGNENYFTGEDVNLGSLFRSFFTFDLSTQDLTGKTIVSATLELTRYVYVSSDSTETISFFDVSTDAATLNNTAGTNAAIFDDLGSGTPYGTFIVPEYVSSATETLLFSLNAASIADIVAASGGFFSIGGSIQSITPGGANEGLFSTSGAGVQRLTLETVAVPEPSSILVLGIGLAALTRRRYRCRRS